MLNKYFDKNNNIEDVDHDIMETFLDTMLDSKYDLFLELYQDIWEFSIKSRNDCRKISYQNKNISKIIGFVYRNVMKFPAIF